MRTLISIVGTLFLRTVERAERIYQAMLSRGFSGTLHSVRPYRIAGADVFFLAVTFSALYLFKVHDVVGAAGKFMVRVF